MIRIDHAAIWIFIVSFALIVPSYTVLGYVDELSAACLAALAIGDAVINGNVRRYTLLWTATIIMAFYVVYSIVFQHYNTAGAIIGDSLIQIKSVIALGVFCGIKAHLTGAEKCILKTAAIANCLICTVVLLLPNSAIKTLIGHPANCGICIFLSTMVWLMCSANERGEFNLQTKLTAILMFSCGLMCTRSKYYGEFVMALFFLFIYRHGMFKGIKPKYIAVTVATVMLIIAVGWHKFSYYFLVGNSGRFDPSVVESFARPVLYATGALIIVDHIPFGSGLASFASYKSSEPYSSLYNEYGIDKVHGLSEAYPAFICDAYYPTLAQFGIAGILLFITLIAYICKRLLSLIKCQDKREGLFVTGVMCVGFILIESIANSSMVKPEGVVAMSIAGIVCGYVSPKESTANKTKLSYV